MSSLEKLIRERKKKEDNRPKELTQEELDEQVRKWADLYRKNWDLYATEELGLPLKEFQKYAFYEMGISDYFFLMCGRGLGKSFDVSCGAFIHCMLYPNATVVIEATTIPTAKRMVQKKMEGELCTEKFSKKLNFLYKNNQITFKYADNEIRVDFKFNNSKILVLPEVDASAGERATMLIFEEVRMSKQYFVNRIFRPMKYARPSAFRMTEKYKGEEKKYAERAKEVYLTSTSYTFEWWFQKWVTIVEGFFNSKSRLRFGIFVGDIITSIFHGFTTQEEFEATLDDPTISQEQIDMEYYNIPQGGAEGSWYSMEKIKENSVITDAFIPPTYDEFVIKYDSNVKNIWREKGKNEVRAICVDFASTDTIKTTQENDNSVIICMSGAPNKKRTHIIRNVDRIETFSGGDKENTLKRIRELFYFYQADIFIYDNQQVGGDRFQDLSKPYDHPELGVHMNGFGILDDREMTKNFCEDAKIDNLKTKVVDSLSIPVAIPVVGTGERNQNFHVSMQKAINQELILFLEDAMKARNRYEKEPSWLLKTVDERLNTMLGYVQTNSFAVEASELQKDIKSGYIHLFEIAHHPKDRIMTAVYGNYYFSMLEVEMLKNDQQSEEIDLSEWEWLKG